MNQKINDFESRFIASITLENGTDRLWRNEKVQRQDLVHFIENSSELKSIIKISIKFSKSFLSSDHQLEILDLILSNLPSLEEIHIAGSDISKLPETMTKSKNLRSLKISYNQKIEDFTVLNSAPSMHCLALSNIMSPKSLSEILDEDIFIAHLEELSITSSSLDNFPRFMINLPALDKINFHNNILSEIPSWFKRLNNISHLDLSLNEIEEIPKLLGRFKNLQDLNLGANLITKISEPFFKLEQLHNLKLNGNNIKEIPLEFSRLRSLVELDISYNHIKHIPSLISNLPNLERLLCGKNPLIEYDFLKKMEKKGIRVLF